MRKRNDHIVILLAALLANPHETATKTDRDLVDRASRLAAELEDDGDDDEDGSETAPSSLALKSPPKTKS